MYHRSRSILAVLIFAGFVNTAQADTIVKRVSLEEAPATDAPAKSPAENISASITSDTMAYEGSPSSNYCSSNQFEIGTYSGNDAVGHLNTASIPLDSSVTVTRVALRIHKISESNTGADHRFYFAQINQSWAECSVTWNSRPTVANLTVYGPVDLSGPTGWYEIILPNSYVTNELSQPSSWHGIAIGSWTATTDLLRFASSEASSSLRPYLTIEYEPDAALPDLVVQSATAPAQAAADASIEVSATVCNIGDGESDTSRLGYYLSRHTYFDASAILLDDDGVSVLSADECSAESQSLDLSVAAPDPALDPYYILFRADAEAGVTETDESNNYDFRQIAIHGKPQFSTLLPSTTAAFESETFSLTLAGVTDPDNDVARVDFWWDSFQDDVFDPESDLLLGADHNGPTWSLTVPVGTVVAGNLRFFAVVWDNFGLRSNEATATLRVIPSLYPVVDISKPGAWSPSLDSLARRFTDLNLDGLHSPGEPLDTLPPGSIEVEDNSCWMATAANLVQYRYGDVAYDAWCEDGLVGGPIWDPFGQANTANSGARFTFDDTGYPHWILGALEVPYAKPIVTDSKFDGGTWTEDPIVWCLDAIANDDRPVAICAWWGEPQLGAAPGLGPAPGEIGYHCVTVWGIDQVDRAVLLTDSDDSFVGARRVSYTYEDGVWTLLDLYTDVPEANVNYAAVTTRTADDVADVAQPLGHRALVENLRTFPNPSNPRTTIGFTLTSRATVALRVFDVQGRTVRILAGDLALDAGQHEFAWDGCDDRGQAAASGVYVCRLEAGPYSEQRRVVLLK